jgi:hypothetical protein
VFDFIERLLLKETPVSGAEDCEARARFIGKFQQLTGPISAKAIEDTALYVYNRLLSLNEVGADPTVFGVEPAEVHRWMEERQRRWPRAVDDGHARHETRRRHAGASQRAVGNAGRMEERRRRWRAVNRRHKTEIGGVRRPDPTKNTSSTRRSSAPGRSTCTRTARRAEFQQRIEQYMMKALREAKVHSSWLSPDDEYEGAVFRFIDAILDRRRANRFFQLFEPFQSRIAQLGIYNSLASWSSRSPRQASRFLPGRRTVGSEPRRPGQPPAGDFDHRRRAVRRPRFARAVGAARDTHRRTRQDARHAQGSVRPSANAAACSMRGEYVPLEATGARATACSRSRAACPAAAGSDVGDHLRATAHRARSRRTA